MEFGNQQGYFPFKYAVLILPSSPTETLKVLRAWHQRVLKFHRVAAMITDLCRTYPQATLYKYRSYWRALAISPVQVLRKDQRWKTVAVEEIDPVLSSDWSRTEQRRLDSRLPLYLLHRFSHSFTDLFSRTDFDFRVFESTNGVRILISSRSIVSSIR